MFSLAVRDERFGRDLSQGMTRFAVLTLVTQWLFHSDIALPIPNPLRSLALKITIEKCAIEMTRRGALLAADRLISSAWGALNIIGADGSGKLKALSTKNIPPADRRRLTRLPT